MIRATAKWNRNILLLPGMRALQKPKGAVTLSEAEEAKLIELGFAEAVTEEAPKPEPKMEVKAAEAIAPPEPAAEEPAPEEKPRRRRNSSTVEPAPDPEE